MDANIIHLKNALENIYENANRLEEYSFNSLEIKELVKKYDAILNGYFDDTNNPSDKQFKKLNSRDFNKLAKDIYFLHSKSFEYISCIYIFKTLDDIEENIDSYDEKTYKYNADRCLYDLQKYTKILPFMKNNNELNKRIPTIYKLIKLELKYSGNSNILNLFKISDLDKSKLEDEVENDMFVKYKINNLADLNLLKIHLKDNSYLHKETILPLALIEGSFLEDLIKTFNTYNDNYNFNLKNKNELLNTINKKEKVLKKKIKNTHLYTTLLPFILSTSIILSSNIIALKHEKNYTLVPASTYEYYSSIDDSYNHTETIYKRINNEKELDTTLTIYYPCDKDKTRIIKTFNLVSDIPIEDFKNFNYDNLNFTSSIYKYDQESNQISEDEFMIVKRLIKIDYTDMKNIFNLPVLLINILANILLLTADYIIGNYMLNDSYYTLTVLLLNFKEVIDLINNKKNQIKNLKNKLNIKKDKEKIKYLNQELEILNKNYNELIEKYSHVYEYLNNNNYNFKKTLKK